MNNEHFVDFSKYCEQCVYSNVEGWDDPCNECLTYPVNVDSRMPINFKEE